MKPFPHSGFRALLEVVAETHFNRTMIDLHARDRARLVVLAYGWAWS